jgi:serine/threonine protein kinase
MSLGGPLLLPVFRPSHELIGRLLSDRFQVVSFIREGGMAQVFCGAQDAEPRHVAIKVLPPALAGDAEMVERFLREARAGAELVHPNIVRTLAVGEDGSVLYIVMELVVGDDLLEVVQRDGPMEQGEAVTIAMDVCLALEHAHQRGIIHRDIKPENVVLGRSELGGGARQVKVLDFGIAKIFDGAATDRTFGAGPPTLAGRSALTKVGATLGSPAYLSPEQGRAEAIDHRADLYSLGVLLFELLTGRLPFDGETPMQVVARHVNDPPPAPSQMVGIHPRLDAIVLRMLSKRPDQRHPSAAALHADLAELMADLRGAPSSTGRSRRHRWSARRRRSWRWRSPLRRRRSRRRRQRSVPRRRPRGRRLPSPHRERRSGW